MTLEEGKEEFIQAWGTLGTNWGINKTMGQVHGLLLIAVDPMCADNIMETLKISRGNANMNIRALIDWGIVYKKHIMGERKEYFVAEKDMWKVFRSIAQQRRKKELEPLMEVLNRVKEVEVECDTSQEFKKVTQDIQSFAVKAEKTLDGLTQSEKKWFFSTFMNIIK